MYRRSAPFVEFIFASEASTSSMLLTCTTPSDRRLFIVRRFHADGADHTSKYVQPSRMTGERSCESPTDSWREQVSKRFRFRFSSGSFFGVNFVRFCSLERCGLQPYPLLLKKVVSAAETIAIGLFVLQAEIVSSAFIVHPINGRKRR
jgi:hypothetical protein